MSAVDPYSKTCRYSVCGKSFTARRRNQEFCCPDHHSKHNNDIARSRRSVINKINPILFRNRCILEDFIESGKHTVSQEDLIRRGFQLNFFTHWMIDKDSDLNVLICYDHGTIKTEEKQYKIVKT